MGSEIPENVYAFAHNSTRLCLLEFCWILLQFEWSKTVSNLGMSRFITDQVVFRCFLYKNFTFILHSKFYIVKDEQLFYNRAKS